MKSSKGAKTRGKRMSLRNQAYAYSRLVWPMDGGTWSGLETRCLLMSAWLAGRRSADKLPRRRPKR